MNNQLVVTAPFVVVDSASQIVNRAPLAVRSVALDPSAPEPSDVPMCRVTPGILYRRDPDYDLVRYRYRWFVRGTLVRDITSAGLADAIPSGILRPGDELRCEVTPRDEALDGPTASVTTSTIQQIAAGGSIVSDNAQYRLTYQTDGNVILFDGTGAALWSTRTAGTTPGRLLMQDDGNLVLYDGSVRPVWASNTSGNPGAYFAILNDGNFVIYNRNGQVIWDRYR